MGQQHASSPQRFDTFAFQAGRVLGGKYCVEALLGAGWEGEVYSVIEIKTGIHRAAKVFYPHRNAHDRALHFYATKLDRLRKCSAVIQYHSSETLRFRSQPITCLISDLVEGEVLSGFIQRQVGRRLHVFEGLHLLRALAGGLEEIHRAREYHGDIHDTNVLVQRTGIQFEVKFVDFFYWGRPTASLMQDDVIDLVRVFYDVVGGARRYPRHPPEIKAICRGLRRDLIRQRFPTVRHLREHLESFTWSEG